MRRSQDEGVLYYIYTLSLKLKHGGERCRVANKQMASTGFETPHM